MRQDRNGGGRRGGAGFTLVELMVVVTVLGILSVMAYPSFQNLIESQRVRHASLGLLDSVTLARSEAVKRNASVTIDAATGGWTNGWSVNVGTETLRQVSAINGIVVLPTPTATSITYTRAGRVDGTPPKFQLDASSTATANARCLEISLSGMPQLSKGACAE